MASSSKQSDSRDMLIHLPKYSPGPHPSFYGWSLQATERVKRASLLNAIPTGILTKVFHKENRGVNFYLNYNWIAFLRDLREYFKSPDTEIEYYYSLQAPTKTVPL